MRAPMEERFWAKVDKRSAGECWPWLAGCGGRPGRPYGSIGVTRRDQTVQAHRYSYELANGPIPDGLHVHHICRNTLCVNPAHLELVTPAEHNRLTGNQWVGRTHCIRGHALSGDNLAQTDRRRRCRECTRIRDAAKRQRRREAA